MGDFGNEYTANLQVLLPLLVAIVIVLPVFGAWFNRLMDKLKGKEHSSIYVAIGFFGKSRGGGAHLMESRASISHPLQS